MNRNTKSVEFDHPGSIDVVEDNKFERELEDLPDYMTIVNVGGKEYISADFARDNQENRQRMQHNLIFCYMVRFFTEGSKSITELFDCYPAAEIGVEELKEYYEENK